MDEENGKKVDEEIIRGIISALSFGSKDLIEAKGMNIKAHYCVVKQDLKAQEKRLLENIENLEGLEYLKWVTTSIDNVVCTSAEFLFGAKTKEASYFINYLGKIRRSLLEYN